MSDADLPIHACGMRLFLSGRELSFLPEGSPNNEFVHLPLEQLEEMAVGSVLLKNWVSLSVGGRVYEASCNAGESNELQEFLGSLRQRWLGSPRENTRTKYPNCGAVLGGLFAALLQGELDSEEEVLAQYFDSSGVVSRRRWLRAKPSWTPGHLVVVTSAGRLLWITDQYLRHRKQTANIRRSVPLARVTAIDTTDVGEDRTLQFRFGVGGCWYVPIRQSYSSAAADFVDAVIGCLS